MNKHVQQRAITLLSLLVRSVGSLEPRALNAGRREASLTRLHTGGTHSPTARRSGERRVPLPAGKEALAGGCSNASPAHSRGDRLEARGRQEGTAARSATGDEVRQQGRRRTGQLDGQESVRQRWLRWRVRTRTGQWRPQVSSAAVEVSERATFLGRGRNEGRDHCLRNQMRRNVPNGTWPTGPTSALEQVWEYWSTGAAILLSVPCLQTPVPKTLDKV